MNRYKKLTDMLDFATVLNEVDEYTGFEIFGSDEEMNHIENTLEEYSDVCDGYDTMQWNDGYRITFFIKTDFYDNL